MHIHSVQPPPPPPAPRFLLGGVLNFLPNFQKGGLDKTLIFREDLVGKGGDLFGWGEGGVTNLQKNKLKSEIFNKEKSL